MFQHVGIKKTNVSDQKHSTGVLRWGGERWERDRWRGKRGGEERWGGGRGRKERGGGEREVGRRQRKRSGEESWEVFNCSALPLGLYNVSFPPIPQSSLNTEDHSRRGSGATVITRSHGGLDQKSVFWIRQGHSTHELREAMVVCISPI